MQCGGELPILESGQQPRGMHVRFNRPQGFGEQNFDETG